MIVSIHHYELADDATPADFREAVETATSRDLFADLPGLVDYHIGRGIRGAREAEFAAVWVYESRDAWETLWGPVGEPTPKTDYPEPWLVWEDDLLAPVLADDPDDIRYTSYDVEY